jgi:hypothetical protein
MSAKVSAFLSPALDPLSANLDQLSSLFARAKGIPCLVQAESSLEGRSAVVDMLKLAMKVTNKVTEISVSFPPVVLRRRPTGPPPKADRARADSNSIR